MKKILLSLAAAVALAACSKDDTTMPEGGDGLRLSFEVGTQNLGADKISRGGYDGTRSVWHAGDEVGLTFGADNNNLRFTQQAGSLSSDGTRVRYTGVLNTPQSGAVTCIAYYPYSSSVSVSGQTVTTTFPATQTYVAGGYKGLPLFAKYAGDYDALGLQFRNLFSVIKLTLSKGSALSGTLLLQRIEFKGNGNETVAGTMSVDLSGANPVVSYPGTGKTTTLDLGTGVELTAAPQTFYIAVPAIDYASGYTFTFVTDKGQVSKSAKNSGATYETNKIYAAPALTIDNLTVTTVIPDGNLRSALQDLGLISILDAIGGKVSFTTAGLQASSLDISGKNIADLTGLDQLPALVTLKAGNNDLVSADLSKLRLLTNLDLSGNRLTGLDLSANTALLSLDVSSNGLTSLDVSANTLLTSLDVSGNGLTGLDLSANAAMLSLDVSSNALTSLDLSDNILLTNLKVYGNPLVTLDISGLKALLSLNLVDGVESVSTLTKTLTIPAAATVQHIISDGVALTNWLNLVCSGNPNLLSVSLKNNTGLLTATVTGNTGLTSLDVSGNATMTTLTASANSQLATLDMTGDLALAALDVSSNALTALDLHNFTLLTSAKVYGNTLTTLNISGLNLLSALYLSTSNNIASLKLTVPAAATVQNLVADALTGSLWTSFECLNNAAIKTISLKNNVKLLSVNATGNANLTSLDVSGNILQTMLRTSGSTLTTLNFSGLKALTALYLNSGNTNCISLLTLTVPTNAAVRNIVADAALLVGTWTRFVCNNNPTVQTISLKNNVGLLGVTVTNDTALTSLVLTGSGLGLAGVIQSGNASGFTVTQ